mgnify:CR=1 FL=1
MQLIPYINYPGNAAEAIEFYTKIKNEYPKSEKGFMADKYINRLKVQP